MAAFRKIAGVFGVVNNFYSKSIITNNLIPTNKTCQLLQNRGVRHVPWIPQPKLHEPKEIPPSTFEGDEVTDSIFQNINNQLTTNNAGRLFAVVAIAGKQFKVTENDLIIIQGYWAPDVGDELKLEKILLVGGTDFSLVGRPILNRELVNINATVIEKTFSHTKIRFLMRKRKQFRRTHFIRIPHTMLRINSINLHAPIEIKKEFEGLDRVY